MEALIAIWMVSVIAFGIFFFWSVRRQKRSLNSYIAWYKLGFILFSSFAGLLLFRWVGGSPHQIWATRLAFFGIGLAHLAILYQQPWAKRDKFLYEKDSFALEWAFTVLLGLLCALAFFVSPRLFKMISFGMMKTGDPIWDAPLLFMLPFLAFKLADFASQIPYRVVEKLWVFPIEPIRTEGWPWRNLMQVNFQLRRSLLEEYRIFSRPAYPYIEVPKDMALGDIFRLLIFDRRRKPELTSIQDLGDEYRGEPKFWWLFSIKWVWWKPTSWFRSIRYLNPDDTLSRSKVRKGDIILARRIPLEEGMKDRRWEERDCDTEKTTIIKTQ
jgi:hypothetical protein